ncbi:Arylesterase [Actinoalloteichus hoggarensis]|uniref:Arylesterase n=2 Tax=Actinoalloteichus hoggarensis TaxID=1470176 RepID=A0A221WBT8_9PSEU|nr:Arylesterase [Actinoalloteichus hoggarensis]
MRQMPLSADRKLEYEITGPDAGPAVLVHHGMPGSALPMATITDPLTKRGYRVITYSRAGYGESTPSPGRTVADSGDDCVRLLEQLSIPRYHVFGWSGGGPHALANAAMDPKRVAGVLISASFAPFDAPGLDFTDGMGAQNQIQFDTVATGGEQAAREIVAIMSAAARVVESTELVDGELGSLFPDVDVAAMSTGFGTENAASIEHALRNGNEGWIADVTALVRPWGFDPGDIKAPVDLWHGGLDKTVPAAHGRWLAENVDGVEAYFDATHGHISLTVEKLGQMMDASAARASRVTSM